MSLDLDDHFTRLVSDLYSAFCLYLLNATSPSTTRNDYNSYRVLAERKLEPILRSAYFSRRHTSQILFLCAYHGHIHRYHLGSINASSDASTNVSLLILLELLSPLQSPPCRLMSRRRRWCIRRLSRRSCPIRCTANVPHCTIPSYALPHWFTAILVYYIY